MSPPRRQRYCWNIAFATGCRRVGRRKWTNRRIRVPAFMRSCRIEEELTWVKTFGKEVEEYVTKVIAKDGTVTRFGGRFPHFIEEEEEKKPKPYNLYGFVDLMENEQVYAKTGFAPHRIPQSEGNHNGWLSEEEEADSDSESTARVSTCVEGGIYNYGGQHNYTCATTQVDLQRMPPRRATGEDENHPDIATLLAQQLQNLLPEIVNQVTASVNSNANNGNGNGANGGNGRNSNNGCTYKSFMSCNPKEYDGKGGAVVLTRWIERMETVIDNSGCAENQKVRYVASSLVNKALTWWNTQVQARDRKMENEFWNHKMIGANHAGYTDRFHELAKLVPHLVTPESARIKRYMAGLAHEIRGILKATQPATIPSAILKAGILTNEAVSNGTLTKGSEKRKSVDEPAKVGGSGRDVKKAKGGTNFVGSAPSREGYAGSQPWCAKCLTHHHEKANCRVRFNCQKPGHFARDCHSPAIPAVPVNVVDERPNQRSCFECGDPNHLRNVCPKLNQESGQSGNQLALGWCRNDRGGGNQVRGKTNNASMNAVEAAKDVTFLNFSTLLSTPTLSLAEPSREPTMRRYLREEEDEREPMFVQTHDPDYVLEPIYPKYIPLKDEHEFLAEEQPLPPVDLPNAESPRYVTKSDPEEDLEEYEDDETEDGPVDYPMDGGDDGDDDDGDSSGDDADEDEDDEDEDDEDEEDEEEEHLAPADSTIVVPVDEPVFPPEGTEPVIPPPSF
ncbi:putative reverse transcriptase domain-containing protein [Tanacetum coccineum]|uniref:Reverse transcriptase domain-containing protein n=1 Tax=Tanacetum coccineum TaxID=301880 RepID=A0ABQ5GCB3_9ASTR